MNLKRPLSLLALLVLSACAAAPPPASPHPPPTATPEAHMTPEKALEQLYLADKVSEDWFAASFLARVPIAKVREIIQEVRKTGGALKSVRPVGDAFLVELERSAWEARVKLDEAGRFTTLLVRPAAVPGGTLDDALASFRALPGKVSVLVLTDDAVRGALSPDEPLAVGSTFKLAILSALRADVDQKKRSWKDVIELAEGHRSLPSGFLQDWPDRAPLTLYSLAALMISISDNTATDALLALVGRETVEALAPRNKPFLFTREVFQLKGPEGAAALSAFQHGDEAARRRVLEGLAQKPLPKPETYPDAPTALDVEWFFTARELCSLMKRVHDLPLMGINPGPVKKSDWDAVAYKGGSEPGVLSMTSWLQKGGRSHCVSATWNAPQKLDELRFSTAFVQAAGALK